MNDLTLANDKLPAHLQSPDANTSDDWGDVGRTAIPRIKVDKNCLVLLQGATELIRSKPFEELGIVLLGPGPLTRSYFKNAYTQGSNEKPTCWSIGAEVPSSKCPEPQHATCRGCPQDMKNSSAGMANAKACRYRRSIAVWVPSFDAETVFSMSLPATSLFPSGVDDDGFMSLYTLINKLKAAKIPPESRMIYVKCDPNSTPTKPLFSVGPWLEKENYFLALDLKKSEAAQYIINPNVDEYDAEEHPVSAASDMPPHVKVNVTEQKPQTDTKSVTLDPFTKEVLSEEDPMVDEVDTYWKNTKTNQVAIIPAGDPIPDGLVDHIVEIDKDEYDALSSPAQPRQRSRQRMRRSESHKESEAPQVVGSRSSELDDDTRAALDALGD